MKSAQDTAEAVSFVADMARELADIARKAQQSNLAYLLEVAALEARRIVEIPYPDAETQCPEDALSRH
jgi:hypothetical protein